MNKKEYTVIEALNDVMALSRAGQLAGQTNVAKIGGVTPPRAKGVLSSAVRLGLLYTYRNRYRPNIMRCCYGVTGSGMKVLDVIEKHKESTVWWLSGE